MGIFTFKWPHHAEEVYVTGTFDNWSKTVQLEKVGQIFQKTVTLPNANEKIFYKFVVDGAWTTDHAAPQEKDHEGNDNNVLLPQDVMDKVEESVPATAVINSVAPESTTAQLAAEAPLETTLAAPAEEKVPFEDKRIEEVKEEGSSAEKTSAELSPPGTYPETPATELDKQVKIDPLPATIGAVNPIKLAPGEPVPRDVTAEALDTHVTLDKDSYEKSDRIPGLDFELPAITGTVIPESSLPILGTNDVTINTVTPDSTTAILAAEVPLEGRVPEIVKQSQEEAHVSPEASAVPEEVKEKAAVEEELLQKVAEAPSTSEGTAGKGTEKSETDKSVPETIAAVAATAGATLVGAAIVAAQKAGPVATEAAQKAGDVAANLAAQATDVAADAAHKASDAAAALKVQASEAAADLTAQATEAANKATDTAADFTAQATSVASGAATNLPDAVKEVLPESAQGAIAEAETAAVMEKKEAIAESVALSVPVQVKESLRDALESPEAAANSAAVFNKQDVEAQLLKEVKPIDSIEESAAKAEEYVKAEEAKAQEEAIAAAAKLEQKARAEADKVEEAKAEEEANTVAAGVPVEVKESLKEAGESPKAASNAAAVEDKKQVEAELLQEVKAVKPIEETKATDTALVVEPPAAAEEVKAVDAAQPVSTQQAKPITVAPVLPEESSTAPAVSTTAATVEEPTTAEQAKPTNETITSGEAKPATNGSTAAAEATAGDVTLTKTTTAEQKKKNRFSGFFAKLKQKFH
ncbi:hypothetical protein QBC35DRAFT_471217 [Podospora australis]|uniref:AMP-activated protein kinase glycogen-binding domain-containing protein n=1 Tax=Podospora australis TaxID=1536484 RepID=A0AAN6X301_9PEZI|nr:hypothetical protein QBC35DRAFT_471217 [Podospora australis]